MVLPQASLASVLGAACLTIVVSATGHADSRPTRSECIVGFRLDWSQVKGDRHEIRNSLFLGSDGARTVQSPPAMAKNPDASRLYMQFRGECGKKDEFAAEVIAYWRSKGLELPRLERIAEPIVPSMDTIEVWGPFWRDQPEHAREAPK